jgi:chromosome segregation ATPase
MALRDLLTRPIATPHDEELAALRQQLAAADAGLAGLDAEQRRLLDQIAARERVLHRASDATADQERRKEAERRAAALAEHAATGKAAKAAYTAYRAVGIALWAQREQLQQALDRHEAACLAAGLPTLATDSAGLALGTGDLPDFREWGKV